MLVVGLVRRVAAARPRRSSAAGPPCPVALLVGALALLLHHRLRARRPLVVHREEPLPPSRGRDGAARARRRGRRGRCAGGARCAPSVIVRARRRHPGQHQRDRQLHAPRRSSRTRRAYKRMMLSLPRVPTAKEVPRDVMPDQYLAHFVTIGWLLDGVALGAHPEAGAHSRPPTIAMDDDPVVVPAAVRADRAARPTTASSSTTPLVFSLQTGPAHRRAARRTDRRVASCPSTSGGVPRPTRSGSSRSRARTSSRCGRCRSA